MTIHQRRTKTKDQKRVGNDENAHIKPETIKRHKQYKKGTKRAHLVPNWYCRYMGINARNFHICEKKHIPRGEKKRFLYIFHSISMVTHTVFVIVLKDTTEKIDIMGMCLFAHLRLFGIVSAIYSQ